MDYNSDIRTPVGLLRIGNIVSTDPSNGTAVVQLTNTPDTITGPTRVNIDIPYGFSSSDGLFVGGVPSKKTSVVIGRGEGGRWHFVSFFADNRSSFPSIDYGTLLLQSSSDTKITLDLSKNIEIGSSVNKIHINTGNSIYSKDFSNSFSFTEASRKVDGIIKRDIKPISYYDGFSKLKDDEYYSKFLYEICLDPSSRVSNTNFNSIKNPPFVENREITYEFAHSYNIKDDFSESKIYANNKLQQPSSLAISRGESRADVLNISLMDPNFLIETIKGTVVDIFGNIIDLNREPIGIGKDKDLKFTKSDNISQTFLNIKSAERKSIAYHFEINSRKDFGKSGGLPDVNNTSDFARLRSRFFLDIDKEGQFKLNVPASSETGNVPVFSRYENYSNLSGINNIDNQKDIFHDAFSIKDQVKIMGEFLPGSPKDRISNEHITLGMPYHNILKTCAVFQGNEGASVARSLVEASQNDPDISTESLMGLSPIKNIVNPIIYNSGPKADAGGRSGLINFDGFVGMSFGASTSDKHSIWLDTQGAVLANIGKDLNNISAAISLDGDLIVQIGSDIQENDSKFKKDKLGNNKPPIKFNGGSLDIRVLNDGNTLNVIRIDKSGVTVLTPGTLTLKGRDINIIAQSNLVMEAETVAIQNRIVRKFPMDDI